MINSASSMEHFSNKMFVEANMKAASGSKLKISDIGRQAGTPERMLEMILNDDSIPQNERKTYNDHYASFKSDIADKRVFSPTTKYLNKKNMNFQQQKILIGKHDGGYRGAINHLQKMKKLGDSVLFSSTKIKMNKNSK